MDGKGYEQDGGRTTYDGDGTAIQLPGSRNLSIWYGHFVDEVEGMRF